MGHSRETFVEVHQRFESWFKDPNLGPESIAMEWVGEVLLLYVDQRIQINGRGHSTMTARDVANLFNSEWEVFRTHLKAILGRDAGFNSGYLYHGRKLVDVGRVFAVYVAEQATGEDIPHDTWDENQGRLYELLVMHF